MITEFLISTNMAVILSNEKNCNFKREKFFYPYILELRSAAPGKGRPIMLTIIPNLRWGSKSTVQTYENKNC